LHPHRGRASACKIGGFRTVEEKLADAIPARFRVDMEQAVDDAEVYVLVVRRTVQGGATRKKTTLHCEVLFPSDRVALNDSLWLRFEQGTATDAELSTSASSTEMRWASNTAAFEP
jgi:hypothetical protein